MQKTYGLTLVEVLISMGIFGLIMTAALATLFSTNQLTDVQVTSAQADSSLRQVEVRMKEVLEQAHYIYPPNTRIHLSGRTPTPGGSKVMRRQRFTVGGGTLAALVPSGTTYCDEPTQTYCLYSYIVMNRSRFSEILPDNPSITGRVLTEWRVTGINWPRDSVPAQTITDLGGASVGIVADSILWNGEGDVRTRLTPTSNVQASTLQGQYDNSSLWNTGTSSRNRKQSNALLNMIEPRLAMEYSKRGKEAVAYRRITILARSIPRGAPPIPKESTLRAASLTN